MMKSIHNFRSWRVAILVAILLFIPLAAVRTLHAGEITFGSLLEEMIDMSALARRDAAPFRTI